jgi:hypothetical protein
MGEAQVALFLRNKGGLRRIKEGGTTESYGRNEDASLLHSNKATFLTAPCLGEAQVALFLRNKGGLRRINE